MSDGDEGMKYVAVQVVGMVLLVLGAQGAIRLLIDHGHSGLLGWVPGGFAVWLPCYVEVRCRRGGPGRVGQPKGEAGRGGRHGRVTRG